MDHPFPHAYKVIFYAGLAGFALPLHHTQYGLYHDQPCRSGGIPLTRLTGDGEFVNSKYRNQSCRVGIFTTWERQCSFIIFKSCWCVCLFGTPRGTCNVAPFSISTIEVSSLYEQVPECSSLFSNNTHRTNTVNARNSIWLRISTKETD